MIDIAQRELQKLVRQDTGGICEAEKRMIGKHGAQAHGPRMQYRFLAEIAQTTVTMHNLDLLTNDNVSKDGEEGKHGGKRGLSVYDQKGNMVDFESICQIANSGAAVVSVCEDNNLVAAVNELGRELVDVTLDSSRLRVEEVADHSNVVRHDGSGPSRSN